MAATPVFFIFYCTIIATSAFKFNYVLDDSSGLGRHFDGIGGLSGGGATSKLLVNYPEVQRNQILDFLFKPNFGASLQILKVEIGGDSQSTDGTESSHMHEEWDENYQRGYEWWLMAEAKKRNPDIKLYGLPWAFPGWIGNRTDNPYSEPVLLAKYVVKWILGAKLHHNLTIDYIGIWNERQYDITYIKTLRRALDKNSLSHVKIVASDNGWEISTDMLKDPELAKAVDVIGVHYPGTLSTDAAVSLNKPLWASEDYSTFNDAIGGGCWARILNQNYVNGYMTSTISWNLIASYYSALPFGGDGLMTAVEPWSGHYRVDSPIWMTAHTSQFASLGWKYLPHHSGVGNLTRGGSYVSLQSPDGKDFTIVVETMSHNHSVCIRPFLPPFTVSPQTAVFQLKGSMGKIKKLNVWRSQLKFGGEESTLFEKGPQVVVSNGSLTVDLLVDSVYTFTTLTSGVKGAVHTIPKPAPFPLPYKDNFEAYPQFSEPFNLSPQSGVFEVHPASRDHNRVNKGHGKVARQVMINPPLKWCSQKLRRPVALIGNFNWSDVSVQSDIFVPKLNGSRGAFIAARVDKGGCEWSNANGVFFSVLPYNSSYLVTTDAARTTVIAEGPLKVQYDTWHHLTLVLKGSRVTGLCDNAKVFETTLPGQPGHGFVGVGAENFSLVDFDNLVIEDSSRWLHV